MTAGSTAFLVGKLVSWTGSPAGHFQWEMSKHLLKEVPILSVIDMASVL